MAGISDERAVYLDDILGDGFADIEHQDGEHSVQVDKNPG